MFTGIAKELGEICETHREADSITLAIRASATLDNVYHGGSITVSGICLIVVEFGDDFFNADFMQEILDRSNLGQVEAGSKTNPERTTAAG